MRDVHRVCVFQRTYRFKDKETYYLVGARLLVDTVNGHNLNGLNVKVTITRLNSNSKCVPQSFFCAWERQAKFATPSGPHQDVYEQSSLTAFFGAHKTDEDSGNTIMCEDDEPIGGPHCSRLKEDSDDELPDLEHSDDEGDEPVDDFPGGCLKEDSDDELSDIVPSDDVLFPFAQDASADSKDTVAHSVTKAASSATDGQAYKTVAKEVRESGRGDQDKAGSTVCSHRIPHIEIVNLCDSPLPKLHCCISTTKEGRKADRREDLDRARKNTEHLLQIMKKPREISEVSEKHHLQGAVKWAFLQRGAPTEQQSAAEGNNRQTMSAWVIAIQHVHPIVNFRKNV